MERIPKIIHYCWFGGNPMPELAMACIDSWKKYCPDYKIIQWNESNYDITKNKYMKDAYNAGKWGFVSDYARLDIIYLHGGFYFDTDVEIVKSIEALRDNFAYMGFDDGYVNPGLGFGAVKGNVLIKKLRDEYDKLDFYNQDGSLNLKPLPRYCTEYLLRQGLIQNNRTQVCKGIKIYSSEYFAPKDLWTDKVAITDNTISIHHYNATWWGENEKMQMEKERKILYKYGKWGWRIYSGLRTLKTEGLYMLVRKIKKMILSSNISGGGEIRLNYFFPIAPIDKEVLGGATA